MGTRSFAKQKANATVNDCYVDDLTVDIDFWLMITGLAIMVIYEV